MNTPNYQGLLGKEIAVADGLAGQLSVLLMHRLAPFGGMLEARNLISADLARLASAHVKSSPPVLSAQVDEERRVLGRLADEDLDFLVVKGVALAATVYSHLRARVRTDIDILVPPKSLNKVRGCLKDLGYCPTWDEPSAVPLNQEQWTWRNEDRSFLVDLHWSIRNHPEFEGILDFEELMAESVPLQKLGDGVRGPSHPHALLLSVMHWYVNAPDDRALVWLLDSELLWTSMTGSQRESTVQLASRHGLEGLLGHHLRLCRQWICSDISLEVIEGLEIAGRSQRATGLIRASESRLRFIWFELVSEPGMQVRLSRVRQLLFPSAAYMRQCFPNGSRFGILGLYSQRLMRLVRGQAGR